MKSGAHPVSCGSEHREVSNSGLTSVGEGDKRSMYGVDGLCYGIDAKAGGLRGDLAPMNFAVRLIRRRMAVVSFSASTVLQLKAFREGKSYE